MERFTFFDHTADVKFKAFGKTLEEAFSNCALATTQVMTDVDSVKSVEDKDISVSAGKLETLLYEFLEELIFLLDTEGYLVGEVKKLEISESSGEDGKKTYSLSAVVSGDNGDNYDVHTYIKAVTYSDMSISVKGDCVSIQVVHDI